MEEIILQLRPEAWAVTSQGFPWSSQWEQPVRTPCSENLVLYPGNCEKDVAVAPRSMG